MDYLFAERDSICLALVRGYLNQTMEWLPTAVIQRFGYATMAEFALETLGGCFWPMSNPAATVQRWLKFVSSFQPVRLTSWWMSCRRVSLPTRSIGRSRFSKETVNTGACRRTRGKPSRRSNACVSVGVPTLCSRGRPYVAGSLWGDDGISAHAGPVRVGE